ncbi:MAG: SDR family oxidoreductase [Planctomycetota bacterium]
MDLGIRGKVALITASSAGLGRASARALAAEGCDVALCARNAERVEQQARELASEFGVRTHTAVADVSDTGDLRTLVDGTADALGPIDIAVCNTGGPPPGTYDTLDESKWRAGIDSTLMFAVRMMELVTPGMAERGWGRVVHISSTTAFQSIRGLTISNALRPALHGLIRDWSDELAPEGVTVNAACPGSHKTDRILHVAEARDPDDPERGLEAIARSIPVGRLGEPDEFGAMVAFLCSARAGFITGTSFTADGGATRGVR